MDYEDYPLGIRWWTQIDTTQKPHYKVYECAGRLGVSDLFWFRERKGSPVLFVKSLDELNVNGFKPFLMNMKKLRKKLGELN